MEMHAHSSTSQGQEAASTVDEYSLQNTRQGVITNNLLVALFHQSVSVVGCWATKPKICLVLQKEKLATNVVNQAILGGCASLH